MGRGLKPYTTKQFAVIYQRKFIYTVVVILSNNVITNRFGM